jgi:hypothetical protein
MIKFNKENLGNKVFIFFAILIGVSVLSGFASENSLVGMIGRPIFQYITMPILGIGAIHICWRTFRAFFDKDYFKKDFNLIVFIGHILWLAWVLFITGIIWLSVIKSYTGF